MENAPEVPVRVKSRVDIEKAIRGETVRERDSMIILSVLLGGRAPTAVIDMGLRRLSRMGQDTP